MPKRGQKEDSEDEYGEEENKKKGKNVNVRVTRNRKRKSRDEDDDDEEEEFTPKKTKTSTKKSPSKKKKKVQSSDEEEFEISEEEEEEEEEEWAKEEELKKRAIKNKTKVKYVTKKTDFTINLQNGDKQTIDVVIGNYHNAYEGAYDENNTSESWLNQTPPQNKASGTVIVRDVSMRIPALVGQWHVAHLRSLEECCGAFFWHSEHVGPDIQSAVNLIKEFSELGMQVFENDERKEEADKGLRLIGRYSWDYYRKCKGVDKEVDDGAQELFMGPHCFFVPADHYRDSVFPEIMKRSLSESKKEYKADLTQIDDNGALVIMEGQEYMFAKVFLQENNNKEEGKQKEWIGVRAMLVFTYEMSEWEDASIEDIPIIPPGNNENIGENNNEKDVDENGESVKESEEAEEEKESNPGDSQP